jgi:hypothetical protein
MSRRQEIEQALSLVRQEIAPFAPTLIVVTKTYPPSDVEILKDLGVEDFGENRNEEGVEKSSVLGKWHFQGVIQSQKIRSILSWADVIHSLDDVGHAEKIDRIASESGSSIKVFLQLSLDGDPSRGGVQESEIFSLAEGISRLNSITVLGLMSVPPVKWEPERAFGEIARVRQSFLEQFPDSPFLSAGMSGDYMSALSHGATHIRVGSKILGQRAPRE